MDMEIIDIGTITFLVNIGKHESISEREMSELADAVTEEFERAIVRRQLGGTISIISTTASRGCVTIVITIGAIVAAAGVVAKTVSSFLKDYEKIRKGALLLAQDVNGVRVKVERWAGNRPAWLFRYDLETSAEAKEKLEGKSSSLGP